MELVSYIVAILLLGPRTVWMWAVLGTKHPPPHLFPSWVFCTKNLYIYTNTRPSILKMEAICTSETSATMPTSPGINPLKPSGHYMYHLL
jgi:hypothetical protein